MSQMSATLWFLVSVKGLPTKRTRERKSSALLTKTTSGNRSKTNCVNKRQDYLLRLTTTSISRAIKDEKDRPNRPRPLHSSPRADDFLFGSTVWTESQTYEPTRRRNKQVFAWRQFQFQNTPYDSCSEISSDEDLSSARIFTDIEVKHPPVSCLLFKFTGIPSVHIQFDDTSDVLQFYETFIDSSLMSKIVEIT
ncbi:unnamed protein product [Larinioides sclopetarius]|uniref:Uncharacterized protein n=1 Tax=Larinioides sclopetarius TaxID=280406 RepID=A0AAV1ZHD2_9ARAC